MNQLEQRLERLKRQHHRLNWCFGIAVIVFSFVAWSAIHAGENSNYLPVLLFFPILMGGMIRLVSMKDLIDVVDDLMSDRLGSCRETRQPTVPTN